MHTTRGGIGPRLAIVALSFCAVTARGVGAADIDSTTIANSIPTAIEYGTTGEVGTTGINGPSIISFVPEASGKVNAPSAFSLGTFVVGSQPTGVKTTYDHTPFTIKYATTKTNGIDPVPNDGQQVITGFLNGTIDGPSTSDVVATFSPLANASFRTGDFVNKLTVLDPQVSLVPSTTNFGRTTAQGRVVVTSTVPEPASLAVFATALVGLGLRRRLRARAGR